MTAGSGLPQACSGAALGRLAVMVVDVGFPAAKASRQEETFFLSVLCLLLFFFFIN
jgi:hypothetical protein